MKKKSVTLRTAHTKAVEVEKAERSKLAAAEAAHVDATAKARALFASDGPESDAYRNALATARKAREHAEEIAQSVVFAAEATTLCDAAAAAAERAELIAATVAEHPMAFVQYANAAVRSRVIEPLLVHHGLAEGAATALHEINAAIESIVTENRLAANAILGLAVENGGADPIPGDTAGGRVNLDRLGILAAVRAVIADARCERDPMLARRRERGDQIEASSLFHIVIDGDTAPPTMALPNIRRVA